EKLKASRSARSARVFTLAMAGGQDEQPWLWNSSTTMGAAWAGKAPRIRTKVRMDSFIGRSSQAIREVAPSGYTGQAARNSETKAVLGLRRRERPATRA